MSSLIGNSLIKYYLGIWDNFSNVSAKDWAERILHIDFTEAAAQSMMDQLRPDLLSEYERYQNWTSEKYCSSKVDLGRYYALRMEEAFENEIDPDLPDFGQQLTDDEFAEFEDKAVRYLEGKGCKARFEGEGIVLGHHIAAFLFYLYYSIDELSSRMVDVMFSRNRMYEEKKYEVLKLKIIKDCLSCALADYCSNWESLREVNSSLEFELGYFNNRFYTSGAVISRCYTESTLSQYSDDLLEFFLSRDEKYLTADIIRRAFELKEKTTKRINIFNETKRSLPAGHDDYSIGTYQLESYMPFTAERKDELLSAIKDKKTFDYCWDFLELQGLLPTIDLMLNNLRTRDIDQEGCVCSEDELDNLYDELEFDRNDIIRLVYANGRKARSHAQNYTAEQIEAAEKHILECWKMLDILEDMIASTSVDGIGQYMRLKRQIVDRAGSDEEGTLMHRRMQHIVSLMERKVEELSARGCDVEQLSAQLEQRISSARSVSKNFLIPLAGGEKLYSMFISNNDEDTDFDYSCVAIMYYTALETLLTQYLYVNYLKKTGIMRGNKTRYIPIDEATELNQRYFAGAVRLDIIYKDETNDKGKRVKVPVKGKIPDLCELGTFKYIYNQDVLDKAEELRNYLTHDLGIRDLIELVKYCEKVFRTRKARNNAAHGMHIVSYNDTISAKNETYVETCIEEIDTLSGLIVEFLEMINPES